MRAVGHIIGSILVGLLVTVPAWAGSDSAPRLDEDELFDLPEEFATLEAAPPAAPDDLPATVRLEVLPGDDSLPTDDGHHRRYKKRDLFRAETRLGLRAERDVRVRFRLKAKQRELMTLELEF